MLAGHPTLTALAGALTIAFSAILVRLADVSPETAAFFRCLYALPALWLLARWETGAWAPAGGSPGCSPARACSSRST